MKPRDLLAATGFLLLTLGYPYTPAKEVRAALLGIDWMTQDGLSQSIPPAYTEHLGRQLLDHLAQEKSVA